MDKSLVKNKLLEVLNEKLELLNELIIEIRESLTNDSKSTVGDKHETSRAMAQLEQEKLGNQIAQCEKLRDVVRRIDSDKIYTSVQAGSLVQTDKRYYFLSVGSGSIDVNGTEIFCIAPAAPFAQLLMGKMPGDEISFQGRKETIKSIS